MVVLPHVSHFLEADNAKPLRSGQKRMPFMWSFSRVCVAFLGNKWLLNQFLTGSRDRRVVKSGDLGLTKRVRRTGRKKRRERGRGAAARAATKSMGGRRSTGEKTSTIERLERGKRRTWTLSPLPSRTTMSLLSNSGQSPICRYVRSFDQDRNGFASVSERRHVVNCELTTGSEWGQSGSQRGAAAAERNCSSKCGDRKGSKKNLQSISNAPPQSASFQSLTFLLVSLAQRALFCV